MKLSLHKSKLISKQLKYMLINKLVDYAFELNFFKLKFQIISMPLPEYILQYNWKQQFSQNLFMILIPDGLEYLLNLFDFSDRHHTFIVDNL